MFNQKNIRKLMQQMNVEELAAKSVIIELAGESGGRIIIDSPQVSKMKVMGQETYQVVGSARREETGSARASGEDVADAAATTVKEEDVTLVASQAGVSVEDARNALEESGGDLAGAIMKLTQKD